jgi:NADPH2:quinone reductase
VIAVASTEEKRKLAIEAGAEHVIDSADDVKTRAREISGGGVDVVVDPVGGELAEPALRALRWGGRFLVVGFVAGIPRVPLNLVLLNSRKLIGVEWGAWAMRHPDENRALVAGIVGDVAAGRLRPVEPAAMPLDRVADALRDIETRNVTGKLVLVP